MVLCGKLLLPRLFLFLPLNILTGNYPTLMKGLGLGRCRIDLSSNTEGGDEHVLASLETPE